MLKKHLHKLQKYYTPQKHQKLNLMLSNQKQERLKLYQNNNLQLEMKQLKSLLKNLVVQNE